MVDISRSPGLVRGIDREHEDEIWGRHQRLLLKLVRVIIREAVPFYCLVKDHPYLWELLNHRTRPNPDTNEGRAFLERHGLRLADFVLTWGQFSISRRNSTYLRLMYGHYDWLLEPFDKTGEDLLDVVHDLGDRRRWPGVTEPPIPGLEKIERTESERRFLREDGAEGKSSWASTEEKVKPLAEQRLESLFKLE